LIFRAVDTSVSSVIELGDSGLHWNTRPGRSQTSASTGISQPCNLFRLRWRMVYR
jgi:hypothetical protein